MAFVKGQSGNPGGRPSKTKLQIECEQAAQEASPSAITRLKFWLKSKDPKASIMAANSILNRAFGKPAQAIEHSGSVTHDLNSLSDSDIVAILREGRDEARGGRGRAAAQGRPSKLN